MEYGEMDDMMGSGETIQLHESLNLCGTKISYITDDTMVFRSGNTLVFFSVSSRRNSVLTFPEGLSLDAFVVCPEPAAPLQQGQKNPRRAKVVCALHTEDTEIHVFQYPGLQLLRKFRKTGSDPSALNSTSDNNDTIGYTTAGASSERKSPDWFSVKLMSLSRDGRYLATVSNHGQRTVSYWDLEGVRTDDGWKHAKAYAPTRISNDGDMGGMGGESSSRAVGIEDCASGLIIELTVPDDSNYVDINGQDHLQICIGHTKWLRVYSLSSMSAYGKPDVAMVHIAVDVANIEREIVCQRWVTGNRLVLGTRRGELFSVDVPVSSSPVLQKEHGSLPPQTPNLLTSRTGGDGNGDGNGDDAANATGGRREGGVGVVVNLSPQTVLSSLPSLHRDHDKNTRKHKNHKKHNKRHHADRARRPIPFSLDLTRQYLIIGTDEGSLLWVNLDTWRVVFVQNLNKVGVGSAFAEGKVTLGVGIVHTCFNSSFTNFSALNLRGHLKLIRIVGNLANIEVDHKQDTPLFQPLSLGHFPLAVGFRNPAPIRYSVKMIPVPNQSSSEYVDSQMLVSYSSKGMLQLWQFVSRELIATYQFKNEITCVCPSPGGQLVLVGLSIGVVCALDISNPRSLRVVFAPRLHVGPVLEIKFNKEGDVFATLCQERLFFMRAENLDILGYFKHKLWLNPDLAKRREEERKKKLMSRTNSMIDQQLSEKLGSKDNGLSGMVDDTLNETEEQREQRRREEEKSRAERDAKMDHAISFAWIGVGLMSDLQVNMDDDDDDDGDIMNGHGHGDGSPRLALATKNGQFIVLNTPGAMTQFSDLNLPESITKPVVTPTFIAASVLSSPDHLHNAFYAMTRDKKLKFLIVTKRGKVQVKKQINAHSKLGTSIAFTSSGIAMATASSDGSIALRNVNNLQSIVQLNCHDPSVGGATSCVLSSTNAYLVSAGADGAILVWSVGSLLHSLGLISNDDPLHIMSASAGVSPTVLKSMASLMEPVRAEHVSDFVDEHEKEVVDRERFDRSSKAQTDLVRQISSFRSHFKGLLNHNEGAPALERLDLMEFAVDLEMRDKLLAKCDVQIAKTRAEIEYSHRGKELRAHRIKTQCWDTMGVKGMTFGAFKDSLDVSNFPLRVKSAEEGARDRKVCMLRQIEMMELRWLEDTAASAASDETNDGTTKEEKGRFDDDPAAGLVNTDDMNNGKGEQSSQSHPHGKNFIVSSFTDDAEYVMNIDAGSVEDERKEKEEKASTTTNARGGNKKKKGGKPGDDGKDNEISNKDFRLYHPLSSFTPARKRTQTILLSHKIDAIKRKFNAEFEEAYEAKSRQIEMINEKGNRIKEIQQELRITVDVFQPTLLPEEIPQSVLKVEDHEIKSAKVLTKEQREEKDRLEEIERKKRESQDDAPERALHDMMNGTLESKRDLSLLEQELLKEPWMEEIPAEEMTDEQLLAVAQFEKKVKLIQSEQETRRKLLQTELSKAKNEVADICRSFDSKTKILAQSRIATHRVIYEHERMIIKLMNDLVQEEEEKEEDQMLRRRIGQLSQQLTTADALLLDFRKLTDVVAKELEILQAEEKSTERSFKRDFQEAGEYVDYLYKLFRSRKQKPQLQSVLNRLNTRRRSSIFRNRRPSQISMSGDGTIDHASAAAAAAATAGTEEENTGGGGGAGDGGMNGDGEGGDGSATDATQTQKERIEGVSPFSAPADKSSEEGFVEVDPSDSPDDLDPEVWMRFIQRRRAQIEKEQQVKKKEIKYQEMQQHLFKLENEAESVHQEILALENQYNQLQSSVLSNSLNAEVMIRVLQGQVEIAESPVVTDMKDCEMIERHTVEDLNTVIKRYGGEKINILKDITDSKTHINLRKWQKKKLELEHKDRVDLTTELQLLRVTKSLQSLIKMGGHDNQKAAELKRLDRKIEFLNHATREKTMGKKLGLLKIKRKVRTQNKENERLLETVQELEAAVRERLQISAVRADDSQEDRKAQARMKALVTRRKLVDLAKLQNEEIKFLREQVESLRKRTFASFAQPQPAALPNHYELRNANNISRARSRATMSRGSSRGSMYRAQTR